jgi:type VI protein secretion system component Hcp
VDGGSSIFLSLTLANGSQVEGEAVALGFEKQMELLDFHWGVGQPPRLASKDEALEVAREHRMSSEPAPDASAPADAARRLLASQVLSRAPHAAGGRTGPVAGLTRVPLRDVTFKKRFDIASTVLMKALNALDVYAEAKFTVLRRGEAGGSGANSSHVGMFVVTLQSVHVKEIKVGLSGEGQGATVIDDVTFGYKDIEVSYRAAGQKDAMTFSHRTTAKKWGAR